MYRPLADEIRPSSIDEIVGQQHLIGKGALLRRIIESGNIPNMIFYGPSGTGKTTLAKVIAKQTDRILYKLNATTASISDIREIAGNVDTLLAPNGILIYLDEIQYFNKKQQQSLLEYMENGKIVLIASTTDNPYFCVYNALLSRSTVFEFKPVPASEIRKAVIRAIKLQNDKRHQNINCSEEALEYISLACGGDVRKAINSVELLFTSNENEKEFSLEDVTAATQRSAMRYDRDGDVHYDILSALQKSIRGSDPDAAVHYLGRLLESGDLLSPCRRILVTASEDIGLAYPQAVSIVKSCIDSALQLGLPEARIPLAQAVILLATAPKSNSAKVAIDAAMADIKSGISGDIPDYLKDASYAGAKKLNREGTYRYSHNYDNHYVKQQYLPDEIRDKVYYEYGDNKTEQQAKRYWDKIKNQS